MERVYGDALYCMMRNIVTGKMKSDEIICLNKELMSFRLDDINLEDLEQRLELAIASLPIMLSDCNPNTCNVNCFRDWGINDCHLNCPDPDQR
jgi:hypothetical protein